MARKKFKIRRLTPPPKVEEEEEKTVVLTPREELKKMLESCEAPDVEEEPPKAKKRPDIIHPIRITTKKPEPTLPPEEVEMLRKKRLEDFQRRHQQPKKTILSGIYNKVDGVLLTIVSRRDMRRTAKMKKVENIMVDIALGLILVIILFFLAMAVMIILGSFK